MDNQFFEFFARGFPGDLQEGGFTNANSICPFVPRRTRDVPVRAAQLSQRLGGSGEPNDKGWHSCQCPAHDDTVSSLSLKDARRGRLLVRCFADCKVDKIACLLKEIAAGGAVLPPGPSPSQSVREPADTVAWARQIWEDTTALSGALAGNYLPARGITMSLPETLRAHPRLYHKDSGTYHPALVAAVMNSSGEQVAIHRTWLASDGRGKADVTPTSMTLGPTRGHAVRLSEGGDTLIVAEGIETALSASMMFGAPAWAALSTSGMQNIILPVEYTEIIIAADNDINVAGLRAAEQLRQRLLLQRRKVRILKPKTEGWDFNDVFMSREGIVA